MSEVGAKADIIGQCLLSADLRPLLGEHRTWVSGQRMSENDPNATFDPYRILFNPTRLPLIAHPLPIKSGTSFIHRKI